MFVRSCVCLALTLTLIPTPSAHASIISDIQEMFEPAAEPPTEEQIMEKVDAVIDTLIVKAETKIWNKYQLYVFGLLGMLGSMVVFLGISLWFNRRNRRRILATLAEVEANRQRITAMFNEIDANQKKIAGLVKELNQLVCKTEPVCLPVAETKIGRSRTTEAWDSLKAQEPLSTKLP